MTSITLYEFEPTRSSKCRWALLEAGLAFDSVGGGPEIIGSDELKKVQPLGKLPAAVIDGKPLFESSAIVTAIADLAPEKNLIAKPGTHERALHDQWTCFALAELESFAWVAMLNSMEFLRPKDQHVSAIVPQMKAQFQRGASAVEQALTGADYIIGNQFSVTDINLGYGVSLGRMMGFLTDGFPNLHAYLGRLTDREHCTFKKG